MLAWNQLLDSAGITEGGAVRGEGRGAWWGKRSVKLLSYLSSLSTGRQLAGCGNPSRGPCSCSLAFKQSQSSHTHCRAMLLQHSDVTADTSLSRALEPLNGSAFKKQSQDCPVRADLRPPCFDLLSIAKLFPSADLPRQPWVTIVGSWAKKSAHSFWPAKQPGSQGRAVMGKC